MTPRMMLLTGHLHGLGARAVAEFLHEIGTAHAIEGDLSARLERYRMLDRDMLVALSVDGFPARPLRRVA